MKQVSTTKNSLVLSAPLNQQIDLQTVFSKYRSILLLAVLVMVISSCHKDNNHIKKTVPLIATFQTIAKTVQDATDVIPELDSVTGKGEGTPIGRSTFKALSQFTPPDYNLTGNGIITTENGDQISFTGQGSGPDIDDKTGNILLKYHASITGGTGKFAEATGEWNTIAHANINTPTGIDSLRGTITY